MLGLLNGIRVTDFTWVGAGAYASLLCQFLGAEVLKIESRQRLDVTRYVMPKNIEFDVNRSAMFNEMNLGKRSVTLNLSKPQGIDLAKRLIEVSDVVIENFTPGVMKKLGLDYSSLVQVKPDIVMLSYSLSGQHGAESGYAGYAPVAGALSGLSHMSGYADGMPSAAGGDYDLITGAAAIVPLLGALFHRRKTGKGQYVDFASREAGTTFIGEAVLDYSMNSRNQSRNGNRHDVMAPHNCYRCRGDDRWVSIVVADDEEWKTFCRATGHPQWYEEARFRDARQRWLNQEEIDRLIEEWTRRLTDYEVMDILQKSGIAAMPVLDAEQLATDRHLKARGIINEVDHPVIGKIEVLGVPWKLSDGRPQVVPAPLLGEANNYVFQDLLALNEEEISRLEDDKIIY